MNMDRGRQFTFDENVVTESNFLVTAPVVMGEFQRKKVVPEMDAYRYSTIASAAIAKGKVGSAYTPSEADILQRLYYDIAEVQDVVGDSVPLIITMAARVAAILSMSEKLRRTLDVVDFKKGDVNLRVKALDGQHPIISVASGLMKSAYEFWDGKTEGQKKGGFVAAAGAVDVNWIICAREAPLAVSRTDKVRIFDPETYQKKRAWATDYRRFHDLWLLESAFDKIRINTK